MEVQKMHRGRLIDHIQLVVRDLEASRKFYTPVFEALGIPVENTDQGFFWADEFAVSSADSEAAMGELTGRIHVAFQAESREQVDAVYKAALAAGGKDNGAPGLRPYHPGYYGAFFLDPDGNNIEVVYHGPADRSAKSIEVTFEM